MDLHIYQLLTNCSLSIFLLQSISLSIYVCINVQYTYLSAVIYRQFIDLYTTIFISNSIFTSNRLSILSPKIKILLSNISPFKFENYILCSATTTAEAIDIIDVTGFLYWKPR